MNLVKILCILYLLYFNYKLKWSKNYNDNYFSYEI